MTNFNWNLFRKQQLNQLNGLKEVAAVVLLYENVPFYCLKFNSINYRSRRYVVIKNKIRVLIRFSNK